MVWLLGVLALAQSLLSLRNILRWRAFVRATPGDGSRLADADGPPATLIIPCRGAEPGLLENLQSYSRQDYPDFELLVVTEEEDGSVEVAHQAGARVIFAEPRADEGRKVTKLRAAVRQSRPESQVLAFGDSDGRPDPEWLRRLVAPLTVEDPPPGATTSYRWYVPERGSAASLLRAVWNSFIAGFLDHDAAFCWGGGTALRRETFDRIGADEHWRGAVSDDYRLSSALKRAGLKIRFVPACLVPSHGSCSWAQLLSWTTRQIRITRVYAPGLWVLGLAAHGLYVAAVVLLLALLPSPAAILLLAGIVLAAGLTGLVRAGAGFAALSTRGQPEPRLPTLLWFAALSPLIPFLMLYNFIVAGLSRRIEWRGTVYILRGPQQTEVVCVDSSAGKATIAAAAERGGE